MPNPQRTPRLHRYSLALITTTILTLTILPSCASSLFFRPNQEHYASKTDFGVPIDDVWFESADGNRLHGWWMHHEGNHLGTVVFCHGNNKNVTHHAKYGTWMAKRGFDVLIFDYRGYGQSQGDAERAGCIADTCAAIDYALERDPERTVLFGHSLGGAFAVCAAAERPAVRALIAESTFDSYQEIASYHAGWMSFLVPLLLGDTHSPRDVIADLAPMPVFVIHGARDNIVPAERGRALFDHAREPKRIYISERGHHRTPWSVEGEPFEVMVTDFLLNAIRG